MSFKAKSLLVWLFATLVTTVVLVPQQVAAASSTYSEEAACEADATCNECYSIGETFNQAFEECYATLDDPYSCDRFMLTACCQHKVSESDCLLNDPFLAVWWTYMSAYSCINVFPSVEGCESIGVVVTSGGSTGLLDTPAPSAAATATTSAPVAAAPVAAPTTPVPTAAALTLAPVAAAPVETLTTAPAPAAAAPTAPTAVEAGEVTTVTVSANAYDARTDETGCAPDGCTPELTRDGDLTDLSRWSCSSELVEAGGGVAGEQCQIVYEFSEAQVVHSVAISFYKGDTRTRSLNINVNGDIHSVVESSGTTAGLETFELEAAAASSSSSGAQSVLSLGLESVGLTADEFLSIIEVEFEVSDSVASPPAGSPSTPAPVEPVTASPVADVVTPSPTATAASATTVPPTASTMSATTVVPTTATTTTTTTTTTSTSSSTTTSATTIPPSASGASPAPVTTDRDLDLTPSPIDTSTLPVGSGTSSEDTATTTDVGVVGSSSDVCSVAIGCYDDDECLQCITNDQDTGEWEDCVAEEAQDSCGAVFSVYCCSAALSGNDCMANDYFNAMVECLVVDLDECSVDEDWACSAATAISYSKGLITFVTGLAVVAATIL